MEDVRRRCDRIRAQEQWQAGPPCRCQKPESQREVPCDVPVGAGGERGRHDLVADRERFGGLTEVPSGSEGSDVRFCDCRPSRELGSDQCWYAVVRARVHPEQQAESEHVLRPARLLAAQTGVRDRVQCQLSQIVGVHDVAVEGAVLERVAGPSDLGQRPVGEVVGIDEDCSAPRHVGQVRLERRRIHRDQEIGSISWGEDVVVREMDLEGRDAGEGSLGSPDLGREVRQGRQVIAEQSTLLGEPVAGELHPVAGVARDPDYRPVDLADFLGQRGVCQRGHLLADEASRDCCDA